MTLLEYVTRERRVRSVFESFSASDAEKAMTLIDRYLKKKLDGLVKLGSERVKSDGKNMVGYRWVDIRTGNNFRIDIDIDSRGSSSVYRVDFFKGLGEMFAGSGKTNLSVYVNGASMALVLPIIVEVMTTGNFDNRSERASKLRSATYTESLRKLAGRSRMVREDEGYASELLRKKRSLQSKKSTNRKFGMDVSDIEEDIARIDAALNSGNTDSMQETLLSFSRGVRTVTVSSPESANAQKSLNAQKDTFSDPKKAFKMLEKYLTLGIHGNRNCILICGAPGVGKTYRVTRYLKSTINPVTNRPFTWSMAEDIIDGDITTIKGKCSAAQLYKYLWRTKERGQILLIDDCDDAFSNDDCVNLIKAAADAGEDRLVSYGVSKKIIDLDPDGEGEIELPKSFFYNGKIIILTNLRAGKIDTAIRSRSYIQDINFTVESVLQIIEGLLPEMNASGLTEEGKRLAFNFLKELAAEGSDMEISIRTFETCAGIFSVINGDEESMELAREMIRENMRLQFMRGGGRY